MDNYFTILETPVASVIDSESLKANFQRLAAKHHPDKGGEEQYFQKINRAYHCLSVDHDRLKHLLEIQNLQFEARGTVSDEVMACFMPIGELSQKVQTHLKSVKETTSTLIKALLSGKSMELQEQVEKWIDQIEHLESSQLRRIREL